NRRRITDSSRICHQIFHLISSWPVAPIRWRRFVVEVELRRMKRENPTIEICPGITRRTVANGKTMYQMIATLAAGSRMPAHSHPQEQIVHILEGKMRLIVEGVPHELSPGDSFYLASNVPHGVETIEPTRVLDTFSPPRDDYLAIDKERTEGIAD